MKPAKKGTLKINTFYLTKAEFDKINILEGFQIEKERYILIIDQIRIGVDSILLNKKSLFIAEVEFDTELEMNAFLMPISYIQEVTGEQKYSGYEIAKEFSNKR